MYQFYVFYKVIKDKLYQKCLDYYYGNWSKVDRLDESIIPSAFNDFYNLFTTPTYIIDNIYIGNACNAADYYTMKNLNITHIVNVSQEISNYFPEDFNYFKINELDNETGTLEPYFNDFIDYIDNIDSDKNVLVHCFMGSSRSATLVVCYLMRKHNMTFDDAYALLKGKRKIVNLNVVFAKELKDKFSEV